jgi:DNA-binding MarR family transcriptional regulator
LRERGIIDSDSLLTDAGRRVVQRIETLTDELAAAPYDSLSPGELEQLMAELEPISATLVAAGLT